MGIKKGLIVPTCLTERTTVEHSDYESPEEIGVLSLRRGLHNLGFRLLRKLNLCQNNWKLQQPVVPSFLLKALMAVESTVTVAYFHPVGSPWRSAKRGVRGHKSGRWQRLCPARPHLNLVNMLFQQASALALSTKFDQTADITIVVS